MVKNTCLFLLVILAVSQTLSLTAKSDNEPSKKVALVLGAGGESPGNDTIFDQSTSLLAQKLSGANYQVDLLYDGGHPASDRTMRQAYGLNQLVPFSEAAAQQHIASLASQIRANFHRGDQVLVVLNTHGRPADGKSRSHSVATNTKLEPLDLDSLISLQREADAKGVKLTILDLSCFSGATLALAENSTTCVVSLASRETVTWSGVNSILVKNLQKGTSIEDSFLRARRGSVNGYPQISTAEGLATQYFLHPISSLFGGTTRYENEGSAGPANGNPIERTLAQPSACEMRRDLDSEEINTLIANLERLPYFNEISLRNLKRAEENYRSVWFQAIEDDNYMQQTINTPAGPFARDALLNPMLAT